MTVTKRLRLVRGKKKRSQSAAKTSAPKRPLPKPRSASGAARLRKRMQMRKRRVIKRGGRAMAQAATRAAEANVELIREYHQLVDKKLQGVATPKDLADLERVKGGMEAIENEQTSRIESILDQRHNAIMEKLSNLTDELRKLPAVAEP